MQKCSPEKVIFLLFFYVFLSGASIPIQFVLFEKNLGEMHGCSSMTSWITNNQTGRPRFMKLWDFVSFEH